MQIAKRDELYGIRTWRQELHFFNSFFIININNNNNNNNSCSVSACRAI